MKVMVTGERSIRFQLGDQMDRDTYRKVRMFSQMVEKDAYYLLEEIVPSYHTVTIYLRKEWPNMNQVIQHYVTKWQKTAGTMDTPPPRKITIPVCYDEEFGLDIERVMIHTSLTAEEIIQRHTKPLYTVYMMGFLPGFPYLGQLDETLATPRLATPRRSVAKGSVGIGGNQTGIYPLESPGGWNMIGKTPIELFSIDRSEPFFLQAGDRLQFVPIEKSEFYKIKQALAARPEALNEYVC